jgi:hypothetical protein
MSVDDTAIYIIRLVKPRATALVGHYLRGCERWNRSTPSF